VGLVDSLSDEKKEEVLPLIEGQEGVSRLMLYEEETAGRIMTTDYLALSEDLTVEEAIQRVREAKEKEVFYIYVVDSRNHLVGVISLRQLILADPDTQLREVMNPDVISVRADMDQEEVARIVAHYDILAVPVVDDGNHLIGMVTVDDVINIIQDEATEDIYKMVGASEEELWEASTLRIAGYRLPWLAFTIAGEMISGLVIKHYHHTISTMVAVAFFVPLIMALSGAVGNQTQTIIVRAMATGRMEGMAWKILRRQLSVGAIMGLAAGALAFLLVFVVQHNQILGLSVGLSLLISMSISAVIGVVVPVISKKIGVDPALTVPSIATLNDIMGTLIYLSLVTYLLVTVPK
jgi:magnesium transporter